MTYKRALDWNRRNHQSKQAPVEVLLRLRSGRQTLNQRAVASLAVHVRMLTLHLYFLNVRVTPLAALVSGKFRRMRRNFSDGRPAIVPILPKALRHNVVAYHQKH